MNQIVELNVAETEEVAGGFNPMNLVGFALYLGTGRIIIGYQE